MFHVARPLSAAAAVLLAAAALAACGSSDDSSSSASQSGASQTVSQGEGVSGLKVMLVDDDSIQGQSPTGSDGLGIYNLRKAFCSAGADVLVVGPWTVQSGQGSRLTLTGPVTVQAVTPPKGFESDCGSAPSGGKVFGVCAAKAPCVAPTTAAEGSPSASPSDSAALAVSEFLPKNYWPDGPDIVLSGVNFGQNDTVTAVHSGTTNAAVVANRLGKPAIAVSEVLTLACLTTGKSCPQFKGAADFSVRLVGELRKRELITPSLLLNVNYPHLEAGQAPKSTQVNVLGKCTAINFGAKTPTSATAVGKNGDPYEFGAIAPCKETVKNADSTAIGEGHISVVSLDGSWNGKTSGTMEKALIDAE